MVQNVLRSPCKDIISKVITQKRCKFDTIHQKKGADLTQKGADLTHFLQKKGADLTQKGADLTQKGAD